MPKYVTLKETYTSPRLVPASGMGQRPPFGHEQSSWMDASVKDFTAMGVNGGVPPCCGRGKLEKYEWPDSRFDSPFRYNYGTGCVGINENPYTSEYEYACCEGLTKSFGDWDGNGKPYYLCKAFNE